LLLRGLFSEVYLAGDRRPDEDELAARFEVSPATIPGGSSRARRGRLPRAAHGTGTLVTAITRSRHTLNANSSYKAMLRKLVPPATAEEAAASGITTAEPLMSIARIRTADGKPVVYSADRIPTWILGDATGSVGDGSLYELPEDIEVPVRGALATRRPVAAAARLARFSEVRVGSLLHQIDQVDSDDLGHPVMLSSKWHVADVFELCVGRRNDTPLLGRRACPCRNGCSRLTEKCGG
jgi:GntR family transcriptional regulator